MKRGLTTNISVQMPTINQFFFLCFLKYMSDDSFVNNLPPSVPVQSSSHKRQQKAQALCPCNSKDSLIISI